MTGPVLGIDLGTTTTIASVIRDGIPEVIPVEGGSRFLIPSVVHFGENGEVLSVGTEAKKQKLPSPTRTVFSIKRIIGRTFSHPDTEVALMRFPFPIVEGSNDSVLLTIGRKSYSPQEVSSFVLQKAIEYAHRHLGEPTDRVVITVPANFNEAQRRATQNAGKLAGLDVLRIINEPTAAALAYGFGNTANERIAVYDLGGGTFDMTILETRNKVLDVLSTGGNSFLGGDDVDNAILEYLVYDVEKKFGIRVMDHPSVLNTLAAQTEELKIALSRNDRVKTILRRLIPGDSRGGDYSIDLTSDLLNQLATPIVKKTFDICDRTLEEAHLKAKDIDAVIMVGGATKMPLVQREVLRYFGKEPCAGIETELVVSMGAAILAQSLEGSYEEDSPVLLDVTPLALGVGSVGDHLEILIDKNETLPVERTNIFTNAYDDQETVKIRIYQGEGNKKSEALLMGEMTLSGLRKAPRGMLHIEVRFELDTNGVLHVNARDKDTGQRQHIELNILGLSLEDQEIMVIINDLKDDADPADPEKETA